MTKAPAMPQRPSDDLAVLERQIIGALVRLEQQEVDAQGPESYRPYLRHAQVLAWRGVTRQRPNAPREVLDHLQSIQPFIDAFLPAHANPLEEAALALYFALDSLYLADGALEESKVESRLANRDLSLTEREVLRVLLANRNRYLRRGEVQKRLNLVRRPTPARISQILVNLDHENLLVRMQGRAQGNPDASFYALSPLGLGVCQHLGLNRRRLPYFRLEEESWKAYLHPKWVASEDASKESSRVTTVWSYRGGVGRTTAIANASIPLARRMRASNAGRLLVLDFDLESPGLDAFFAPEGLGQCRGLRGLIVDFYKVPAPDRSKWLREALVGSGYVFQPKPEEHSNLFYLPSGFSPGPEIGLDEELGEAYARLQSEAKIRLGGDFAEGEETGPMFLSELRKALRGDLYNRTLVDPHAGLGLSAWAAVLELADDLILSAYISDLTPISLKIALGNFIRQRSEKGEEAISRVGFLVTEARPGTEQDLNAWIEREILDAPKAGNNKYRAIAVSTNEEVDWLDLLEGTDQERVRRWRYRRVICQSIEAALDHQRSWKDRQTAIGLLTEIQDPEFSKVVVEAVLDKAKMNVARVFDAVFLHDLSANNEEFRKAGENLASCLDVAQRVTLNMATYAKG